MVTNQELNATEKEDKRERKRERKEETMEENNGNIRKPKVTFLPI